MPEVAAGARAGGSRCRGAGLPQQWRCHLPDRGSWLGQDVRLKIPPAVVHFWRLLEAARAISPTYQPGAEAGGVRPGRRCGRGTAVAPGGRRHSCSTAAFKAARAGYA